MPHTSHDFQLLASHQYVDDLTTSVTHAKKQIGIMCLALVDDASTHALIEALITAAERGVSVSIAADAFTYSELGGYFSPFKRIKSASRAVSHMAARLKAAGVSFTWLGNGHKTNPFSGVTHVKWSIIDATVYTFGGTNLYQEGIASRDYMFKSLNPTLARALVQQHQAIIKSDETSRPYAGYVAKYEYGTVYIDSGIRRDSIIYDRICELARQADHVLIVTQYCPSGPLASLLKDKSDIYFNQPHNTSHTTGLLIRYGQRRTGLRSLYRHNTYLHAKFMIFTMPDGKKIALTGSHNFSYAGVLFGTREVALETVDSHIINQLENFYKKYIR
jgi:cardiolipin synthase